MKRVLILTYYWPPSGGAGVQRWLKFAKYLPEYGWKPIIYTPLNPESPAEDQSLLKDVPKEAHIIKTKIWEPFGMYKKATGKDEKFGASFLSEKEEKQGFVQKMALWVRGNFFIPDAKRFWIRPSIRHLKAYLKDNPVDVIVSTGPPHSLHLIAARLKKKFPSVKWVADFRDPWTNIDFYKELMISGWADKKHHRLEKRVLELADRVVVVGETMKKEFLEVVDRKIDVITNGYDASDVASQELYTSTKKFSLTHVGSLNKDRNPVLLWKTLKKMCVEDPSFEKDLEIHLVGKVDIAIEKSIAEAGLIERYKRTPYLPHNEIMPILQQSAILLLVINDTPNSKGVLTGKFFEYLSVKRPILAIGPTDGDIAKILSQTSSGQICDHGNSASTEKALNKLKVDYLKNLLHVSSEGIEKYSRQNLTIEMAGIFNEECKKRNK